MNVGHIITGMEECTQNICISLLLLHIHGDGLLIVHLFFIHDRFIVYCLINVSTATQAVPSVHASGLNLPANS